MKKYIFLFFGLMTYGAFADISLPQILSETDGAAYQKAFETQSLSPLSEDTDTVLRGVLQAHLFLSKNYRAKSDELKIWLENYNDLPDAWRIYELAKKKKISGLTQPSLPKKTHRIHSEESRFSGLIRSTSLTAKLTKKVESFKQAIHRGHSRNAKDILITLKKELRDTDYNRLCGVLAFMYFLDDDYAQAKEWAEPAAKTAAQAAWVMGVIYFIQDEFEMAASYFECVQNNAQETRRLNAQGAYWASLSYDKIGDEEKAKKKLEECATLSDSFYSLLASFRLGLFENPSWLPFEMSEDSSEEILSWKGGVRALALIQIGQMEEAEKELQFLLKNDDSPDLLQSILSLAGHVNLPQFSLTIAPYLASKDSYRSASYPIPNWKPENGWSLDPAIVWGVIRQESRFDTQAKSQAGATGLMQVLPTTASFLRKDSSLKKKNQNHLYEPIFNLNIGQDYLLFLTKLLGSDPDLIRLLAAYNAGPKTVLDFDKKIEKYADDPLLYLECFPAKETREYIKNVLVNIWMYQMRLETDSSSLTDLSEGRWPRYDLN